MRSMRRAAEWEILSLSDRHSKYAPLHPGTLAAAHFIPVYKPAWRYGGPVQSVSLLCEGLARKGVRVSVFTTNADGASVLNVPMDRPVDVEGVQVRYFRAVRTPWGIDSLGLRRACATMLAGYDIVHMSAVWQPLGVPIARAARAVGVPYVCSLRGTVNPWAWNRRTLKHKIYWQLFEKRTLREAAALHVTSETEREEALALGVGVGQPMHLVPNGIESARFACRLDLASQFRMRQGIPAGCRIMLHFGRLHPKKGIDLFLRAAHKSLRMPDEWVYVVVGPDDGCYRDTLRALARELGVADKVVFVDTLAGDDRLGAYSAADLFVLTSYAENFGMSVVEAMAASVPILISDQVALARDVTDSDAGVVTELNEASIRAGLESLMHDASLRARLSHNALALVHRKFDIGVVAARMIDCYAEILSLGAQDRQ
ncbi:MAG: glycosyltransferase [Chloroflexota bacterium]